jgi:predicted TIM-barrel fold metal-dependent hydrolase
MNATFKNPSRPFIDADSHIEEGLDVFKYLDKKYDHRKPIIVDVGKSVTWSPKRTKLWLIDGVVRPKLWGNNGSCYGTPLESDFVDSKPVTRNVQGLLDVDEYCASMDEIGLDVAVIYSTLFLHPVTSDPYYEAALMSSWNSFMAETCGKRSDRLRWAALIPMNCPELAVKEVERVNEMGASTIMMLGTVHGKHLHNPEYYPIFEIIQSLKMPISVHVGWSHSGIHNTCDSIAESIVLNFELSSVFGFFSFISGGIFDRFPDLKVAFIEAGVNWFPVALERMAKWHKIPTAQPWLSELSPTECFDKHQIYFTVEGDEKNLNEFVDTVGSDRILGAADFPHVHYEGASLSKAFTDLKENKYFSDDDKKKIFGTNSQSFYNIY